METKVCKKCGEEKPLDEFEKNKKKSDGRTGVCKSCINARKKIKYDYDNKDKIKVPIIISDEDKLKRSERLKEKWKNPEYRAKMCKMSSELWKDEKYRDEMLNIMSTPEYKEKISKSAKGRTKTDEMRLKMSIKSTNKKKVVISGITYNSITEASIVLKMSVDGTTGRIQSKNFKDYTYVNSENYKFIDKAKNAREYRKINKQKMKLNRINRYENDSLYKLKNNIRCSIYNTIRRANFKKKSKTADILGCTIEEFKLYIESKFEPWMNWGNHGNWNGIPTNLNTAWDLDHIIPADSAKDEADIIRLNHYTNFQPLCSYENRYIKRNHTPS